VGVLKLEVAHKMVAKVKLEAVHKVIAKAKLEAVHTLATKQAIHIVNLDMVAFLVDLLIIKLLDLVSSS
jgi:hypothetical protein